VLHIRVLALALAFASSLPALGVDAAGGRAQPASDAPSAQPIADSMDSELLVTCETAWRAWFAGDVAALEAMLPAEFISYGMTGKELSDRARTLAESRPFAASGGRLERLDFPATSAQRYGDEIVLYSLYEVGLVDGAGKATTLRGRATEVFVRRDGRWLHPGWHLDLETLPGS
jgi:hypothetical protein